MKKNKRWQIKKKRKVRSDKGKKRGSYMRVSSFFRRVFNGIKKFLESPFR